MSADSRERIVRLDDIRVLSRAQGGDGRTVDAYAAVFNTKTPIADQDGEYTEQIAPGAFDRSLASGSRIGVFYNHAMTLHRTPSEAGSVPLGRPLEIRPDGRGLFTRTRYNNSQLASDVLDAINNGDITGQSFTGAFLRSDPPRPPYYPDRAGNLPLVTRKEIALMEYGPTPIPAYEDAAILGVRTSAALVSAPDAGQRWGPWERREYLLSIGCREGVLGKIYQMRVDDYLNGRRDRHPDDDDNFDPAPRAAPEDCAWCAGPAFLPSRRAGYWLCADCGAVEAREIRAREIEAAFAARCATKFFEDIAPSWER